MEFMTNIVVSQMLNSLDQTPVKPNIYEKYLAFVVCKNLSDLCDTASAVINKIRASPEYIQYEEDLKMDQEEIEGDEPLENPTELLPDQNQIKMCRDILQRYYADNMFVPSDDGDRANWLNVKAFSEENSIIAYKIYRAIRRNVVSRPESKQIQESVVNKNKSYFIANFDSLFEGVPFREGLSLCKNFLTNPHISEEHQDIFWEYFNQLLDTIVNEKEVLDDIAKM